MEIYHGSYTSVQTPEIIKGKFTKDFGEGFYCTELKRQAEKWARRYDTPVVSIYEYKPLGELKILCFDDMTDEWLDFIVANRSGLNKWKEYDYIEGGIADDRVIDTIEAYMIGNITLEMALGQLAFHRPNNQICLINQRLIDDCLHFKSVEPIKE